MPEAAPLGPRLREFLDSISRALPDTAWLMDVREVDGSRDVVIEGRGLNASALPETWSLLMNLSLTS